MDGSLRRSLVGSSIVEPKHDSLRASGLKLLERLQKAITEELAIGSPLPPTGLGYSASVNTDRSNLSLHSPILRDLVVVKR
jgi:hypothetical protein